MRKILLALVAAATLFGADTIRLGDVKKIYIEKMENGFDEYLRAAISKKFHERMTIVLDKSQADAIMSAPSMSAQRTQSATIDLKDPKGEVVLWSGSADNRDNRLLGVKHGGQQKVADKLASDLRRAMER